MTENLSVSARTARLNSFINNRPEALPKEQKEICNGISRDGLLDALFVLYDECNKDGVKKKSKHIQDFAVKCKIDIKYLFVFNNFIIVNWISPQIVQSFVKPNNCVSVLLILTSELKLAMDISVKLT